MLDTCLGPIPGSLDLPDSDDTPVDNELQNHIPNLLYQILRVIWAERQDWFFGVDMGIYTREGQLTRTAIVPDAFLSLGVPRSKGEQGRLSYVLAEENQVVPILALEIVSQTFGGEYDEKMRIYAEMGIRYTVIYNPHHGRRDKRDPLEVYELKDKHYHRLPGDPVWLEGVQLGIGVERRQTDQWERDWLFWYNPEGQVSHRRRDH
jgi:Uma2 family endonuclease